MADFAVIRPRLEHWPLIYQTWVRGYAGAHKWAPLSRRAVAHATRACIDELVRRPGVEVAVATNPTNHWFMYGYAVYDTAYEFPVLHWLYVKELYRGMDIAGDLLRDHVRAGRPGVLHYTYDVPWAHKLFPEGKAAPHLALPPKEAHGQPNPV